nr:MAG TPA: hypothetical protein [Caudoviricetes sp.]
MRKFATLKLIFLNLYCLLCKGTIYFLYLQIFSDFFFKEFFIFVCSLFLNHNAKIRTYFYICK